LFSGIISFYKVGCTKRGKGAVARTASEVLILAVAAVCDMKSVVRSGIVIRDPFAGCVELNQAVRQITVHRVFVL
jgi:hypothetical protein